MKGESVSVEMFKIWADSQSSLINALTDEMKVLSGEQRNATGELKQTNSLLRDDINTTKAILNQHIKEYNYYKLENNKRFTQVFKRQDKLVETLESREGVYTAAKYIKWVIGIMLVGGLTASGAHIYDKYFVTKTTAEIIKSI